LQKGKGKQMTKREALRQTEQENTLLALGFTRTEAEQLRRISMTLHRWHELECGMDNGYGSYCVVRGHKVNGEFLYSDHGTPHYEISGISGPNRYSRIPDRETGAKKRLQAIIDARNARALARASEGAANDPQAPPMDWRQLSVSAYIQTDPRGAALYIIRPGDVPNGASVESYYNRGICVY
jgi:hypothetical protein